MEKKYTLKEAAELCNLDVGTLRRAIWAGKLASEKFGKCFYIKKEDLDDYIKRITKIFVAKTNEKEQCNQQMIEEPIT